jgi:hypothetical protein
MIKKSKKKVRKDKKKVRKDKKKVGKDKKKVRKDKNRLFKNTNKVIKSIIINYPFWVISMACIYLITVNGTTGNTFIEGIVSFGLAIFSGYVVHYISHAYDFGKLYKECDWFIFEYLRSFKTLDWFITNMLLYTVDFHDKIHHDTKINKLWYNLIIEFIQNVLSEGGFLVLLTQTLKINFINHTFQFNKTIFLVWGLLYASVHNINYNISKNRQHTNHHINPKTNYAMDVLDIMFDTKYDIDNIEDINFNGGFNIIIITFFIIYLKIYI